MKKIVIFLLIIPLLSNSQSYFCGTPNKLTNESPTFKEQQIIQQIRDNISLMSFSKMQDTLLIIPTVVHIIHYSGNGDISDLQVEDGIRVVNEDFRRMNADTLNGNPDFSPFTADCKIEFRLAKLDPNGNSTTGITRTDTSIIPHPEPTDSNFDNVKYAINWPSHMYFNIWLTRHIYAGTSGYSQYPGTAFTYGGPWETYGAVIRSNKWGTIETANSDGRTATHELGHCLGLYHTFLSYSATCGSDCDTTGDEVCDTPPTLPSNGCTISNQCSNDMMGPSPFTQDMTDQLENYMSYNSCQNMFSKGQKNRMRGFLTTLDTLNGLYLDDNLIATGLMQSTSIISSNFTNKKLIKVVDILGREVNEELNIPLFYIYNEGTVEKKIILE